jgi:hypothetical protein
MAPLQQAFRVEVGFTAQLHDARCQAVRRGQLGVGMHQKFLGDLRAGETGGSDMMAPVPQHSGPFRGQRAIEQGHHLLAPRAVGGVSAPSAKSVRTALRAASFSFSSAWVDGGGAVFFRVRVPAAVGKGRGGGLSCR